MENESTVNDQTTENNVQVETQEKVRDAEAVLRKNRELLEQNVKLKEQAKIYEQSEMERKGELNKLLDRYKTENQQLKTDLEKTRKGHVYEKTLDRIKLMANNDGCDERYLDKFIKSSFEPADFDRVLEASEVGHGDDLLKTLYEERKNEALIFFNSKKPPIDMPPSNGAPESVPTDVSKMTYEQKKEQYRKLRQGE